MKIILLREVKNLGKRGEIKEVADGYAWNFLLPQRLVMAATKGNIENIEQIKNKQEEKKERVAEDLSKYKEELEGQGIVIKAKANKEGHLFAGVGADKIAEALREQRGLKVKLDNIKIDKKIKAVGEYGVEVSVGGGSVKLRVMVERE